MAQAIDKAEWKAYCEFLSRTLEGGGVEIEVASLDLGDQIESDWLPMIGITYDSKDDVFDVALQRGDAVVDHLIYGPREFAADREFAELTALEIVDKDGRQHLLRLRDTLALPAPH
ncbi:MAG TPA: DUF5335 family protein [Micropepsaceae bacterium]|nr:DUF5335 family protein [Micropepsaceae bacterium]